MAVAVPVAVAVAVSMVLTCMVGALLPGPAGAGLFCGGLGCALLLGFGAGEDLAVRVLFRGRALTAVEQGALAPAIALLCHQGLGPPVVRIWVQNGAGAVAAAGTGRRSVIVSAGLVAAVQDGQLPAGQAVALIAHASGLLRCGLVRSDPLIEFWTAPWQLLHGLVCGITAAFGQLPLTGAVWRLRFVVAGIAVVQTTTAGHPHQGTPLRPRERRTAAAATGRGRLAMICLDSRRSTPWPNGSRGHRAGAAAVSPAQRSAGDTG